MIEGSCHCGAVRMEIGAAPPESLTSCNCSICRRLGALWAYYTPAQVAMRGETEAYIWGDKALALHRCKVCGVLTHWSSLTGLERVGVNARIMALDIEAIRVRRLDGADTWAYREE